MPEVFHIVPATGRPLWFFLGFGALLFGLLVEAVGYETSWRVAAVVFLAAAALVVVARRMFLADLEERPPREPLGYGGGRSAPRRVTGPRPLA
jgi:membrane protein implicated in regulation of membrane protease activity